MCASFFVFFKNCVTNSDREEEKGLKITNLARHTLRTVLKLILSELSGSANCQAKCQTVRTVKQSELSGKMSDSPNCQAVRTVLTKVLIINNIVENRHVHVIHCVCTFIDD